MWDTTYKEGDQTETQYRRTKGSYPVILEELVEDRCRVVDSLVDSQGGCRRDQETEDAERCVSGAGLGPLSELSHSRKAILDVG